MKVGVVISNRTKYGLPSDYTPARLDAGIELYTSGKIQKLLMSGGFGEPTTPFLTHASAMVDAALRKNVKEEDIITEKRSLDTTGQPIFIRKVIEPLGWRHLVFITNSFHMQRVRTVSLDVFSDEYTLEFHEVPAQAPKSVLENEQKSLAIYKEMFSGIQKGNLQGFLDRLFSQHPLYKGRSLGYENIGPMREQPE